MIFVRLNRVSLMNTPSRRARAIAVALAEDRHARLIFVARALLTAACASAALLCLPSLGLL